MGCPSVSGTLRSSCIDDDGGGSQGPGDDTDSGHPHHHLNCACYCDDGGDVKCDDVVVVGLLDDDDGRHLLLPLHYDCDRHLLSIFVFHGHDATFLCSKKKKTN